MSTRAAIPGQGGRVSARTELSPPADSASRGSGLGLFLGPTARYGRGMKTFRLLCLLSLGVSAAAGVACSGSTAADTSDGGGAGNDASTGGNDAAAGGDSASPQHDSGGGTPEAGSTSCTQPSDCPGQVCCVPVGMGGGGGPGTCGPQPCAMGTAQTCNGTGDCPSGDTCRQPSDGGVGHCRAPRDGGFGDGGFPGDGGGGPDSASDAPANG